MPILKGMGRRPRLITKGYGRARSLAGDLAYLVTLSITRVVNTALSLVTTHRVDLVMPRSVERAKQL